MLFTYFLADEGIITSTEAESVLMSYIVSSIKNLRFTEDAHGIAAMILCRWLFHNGVIAVYGQTFKVLKAPP